jgi:hypothetical protein
MSRSGTEGYAEDLLVATSKLKSILGQQVQVVPLPPLFLAGCTCPMTIRTAAEVAVWAAKVYGAEGSYLTSSFKLASHLLLPRVGEEGQKDYERLVRLPDSTTWPASKIAWMMGGFDLKAQIEPTTEKAESEVIMSIINELRTGLALKLEKTPIFDRKVPVKDGGDGTDRKRGIDYLVIGRSGTAAMVAAALERAGKSVIQEVHPDWRLTAAFVGHMTGKAMEAISVHKPKTVVVAGLDESYFMASYEEVHTLPAAKGPDGRYHIHGDLVLASRETQKKLFELMEPIWAATMGIRTLVLGPVVRYITKGCCDEPDHMPNRNASNFETKLRQVVAAAKTALKENMRAAGHNHCRVMDMAMDMVGKSPDEIWGDDPTIPKQEVFDSLVAAIPSAEARIDLNKKRHGEALASVAKKPRVDNTASSASKEGSTAAKGKKAVNSGEGRGGGEAGGGRASGSGGGTRERSRPFGGGGSAGDKRGGHATPLRGGRPPRRGAEGGRGGHNWYNQQQQEQYEEGDRQGGWNKWRGSKNYWGYQNYDYRHSSRGGRSNYRGYGGGRGGGYEDDYDGGRYGGRGSRY